MNRGRPTPRHPRIIVHGGASDIPEDLRDDAKDGCARAAEIGWDVLQAGGRAVDAVEAAVRALEDDPTFDAGCGSVLNAAGDIELDAIIMDGTDLSLGAVMAVKHVSHPVSLARLIMDESRHNVLAADGAEVFAQEHGLPLVPSWHMLVPREQERWSDQAGRDEAHAGRVPPHPAGTVGAVALDADGHVAAATSTGGTFNKEPGRVGDSPLVGSGAYADDRTGAASATGEGEDLMRIVISKLACDCLDRGMTAQEAADTAVATLGERTSGKGGVIALGRRGDLGLAHSTPCLAHAYVRTDGQAVASVEV